MAISAASLANKWTFVLFVEFLGIGQVNAQVSACNNSQKDVFVAIVERRKGRIVDDQVIPERWQSDGVFYRIQPNKCQTVLTRTLSRGRQEVYYYAFRTDGVSWQSDSRFAPKFCFRGLISQRIDEIDDGFELASPEPWCEVGFREVLMVPLEGHRLFERGALSLFVDGEEPKSARPAPKQVPSQAPPARPSPPVVRESFYVIHRFICQEGRNDAGDCTIQGNGASCQAANMDLASKIAQLGGDPCKRCDGVITDYKRTVRDERIHLGPCQGL